MQQRQLRLGDILDDYCPRERRLSNHVVVAMVGQEVKRTRCVTCDAEHEYKHAKVPRPRRKPAGPAVLYAHGAAGTPKRVTHEPAVVGPEGVLTGSPAPAVSERQTDLHASTLFESQLDSRRPDGSEAPEGDEGDAEHAGHLEEGPVHRPLIRATLPRPEGQTPPPRPAPDFTIRQPGGRGHRFRPRHQHEIRSFQTNWRNGDTGGPRGGGGRQNTGHPKAASHVRRQGSGRKRSK